MNAQPPIETRQPNTHMDSGNSLLSSAWNRIRKLVRILTGTSSYIAKDFFKPDGTTLSKRRLMLAPFALPLFLPRLAIKIIEDYHYFPLQERFRFTPLPIDDLDLNLGDKCPWELHPEEIIIEHEGDVIQGFYISCANTKGYVVFCHGNDMTAASFANSLCRGDNAPLLQGYSIMAVEYPGYGKSSGAIYSDRDVLPVVELFFNKTVDIALLEGNGHLPMSVYGYSIGTGLAAYLAYRYKAIVERIILDAPYYSSKMLAHDYLPVPNRWLSYDIRTAEYLLNACNCAVIATNDETTKEFSRHIIDFPPSKQQDPEFTKELLSAIFNYNLKQIFIIHSLYDELIPVTHSVKINELLESTFSDQQKNMEKYQERKPPENYNFSLYMKFHKIQITTTGELQKLSLNHSWLPESTINDIQFFLNHPLPIKGACQMLKTKGHCDGFAIHQD